MDVGI